jgi:3-deoxy-D-manno-octulosonate 8-phosphate phosphatase (KDO 8-P phosphatase)
MAYERIRLVALDADGVLTDGTLFYGERGAYGKSFSVRDGLGLELLKRAGIATMILSGKRSGALVRRSMELSVDFVFDGVKDKLKVLRAFCAKHGYAFDEICYMGDDLPDIRVLKAVGLAAAPADAVDEVKRAADLVVTRCGGRGAVRELVERLLKGRRQWEETVRAYF